MLRPTPTKTRLAASWPIVLRRFARYFGPLLGGQLRSSGLSAPQATEPAEFLSRLVLLSLTGLFVAMIVAISLSAVFGGDQWGRVQEFVQITFGTVAGLVGSAVGFYFGSQR